jgi:hypothetical protein
LRSIQRLTARLLVAPVLAFAWGVAPAHVHHGHDDHAPEVVHQHLAPHHVAAPAAGVRTVVAEHDDDDVVWLDGATLRQPLFQFQPPLRASAIVDVDEPTGPSWFLKMKDHAAPAHGPPRASLSFRGPPSSCLI